MGSDILKRSSWHHILGGGGWIMNNGIKTMNIELWILINNQQGLIGITGRTNNE